MLQIFYIGAPCMIMKSDSCIAFFIEELSIICSFIQLYMKVSADLL